MLLRWLNSLSSAIEPGTSGEYSCIPSSIEVSYEARHTSGMASKLWFKMHVSKRGEAGSAFVELGLFIPVLLLMAMGAVDFARVFFASISLTNAAEVGALYGSRTVSASSDTTGMQTAATTDASDLTGVTATAQQICTCSTSGTLACNASCAGTKKTYVSVQTSYTFTPLAPIPGIPSSIPMTRQAILRVQ